ncbi:hypothetical protein MC885_000221, partial [Smutsia gigantea]
KTETQETHGASHPQVLQGRNSAWVPVHRTQVAPAPPRPAGASLASGQSLTGRCGPDPPPGQPGSSSTRYPAMICSLLLAFLLLLPATVAISRADNPCLACGGPVLDLESQRELLLNLAKRSILDMLHLSQRPTLSRPGSRAALRSALQRLHGPPQGALLETDRRQEYEIISFAEIGLSNISQTRLDFHFSPERTAGGMEIQQISLMFFVQLLPNTTWTLKVRGPVLGPQDTNLPLITQHLLEVDASGRRQLFLGPGAQGACKQGHLTLELVPEGHVAQRSVILDGAAHRPFVAARVRVGSKHQVHRRGIECQGGSRMCCRQEFFVDFREIGWHDWIIQPEGYTMNFCTGQCPLPVAGMPGIAASFHTAVLSLLKANSATGPAGGGSCGTGVCCCGVFTGLHTIRSTEGATATRGSRPDPGSFTRSMGLPAVQLWLVLVWALVWAQGARAVCPSCGGPTVAPQAERALVLELAKQQILDGLHLTRRPRIIHPLPQAALTRALRRLRPGSMAPANGEEIISFASSTESSTATCSSMLTFHLSTPQFHHLYHARLWLHVLPTLPGTLYVRIFHWGPRRRRQGSHTLLAEHQMTTPGWHALALPSSGLRGEESGVLRLQLDCRPLEGNNSAARPPWRLLDTMGDQRPFLELKIQPNEPGAGRTRRRTPTCEPETPLCCRRDHYVDFQELGWRDWILQPEGYQLNY